MKRMSNSSIVGGFLGTLLHKKKLKINLWGKNFMYNKKERGVKYGSICNYDNYCLFNRKH